MRVVITTAGSRGDVAPYTGLARRLNDAGHTAVVATHEPVRAFVEAHGIEFAGLPADPRQLLAIRLAESHHEHLRDEDLFTE